MFRLLLEISNHAYFGPSRRAISIERVQSQESSKLTDYDPTPSLWRKYFHNRNRKNLQDNRFLLSYVEAGRRMRMDCQTESGKVAFSQPHLQEKSSWGAERWAVHGPARLRAVVSRKKRMEVPMRSAHQCSPLVRAAVLTAVAFAFTVAAADNDKGPLVLEKFGSFFVGGKDVAVPYRSGRFISPTYEAPDVL